MKKILLLVGWFVSIQGEALGQLYNFTQTTTAYTPLPSPSPLSVAGWSNEAYPIPVGFPFMLGHQTFTSVQVNSDGYLDFAGTSTEGWIDGFFADLNDRNLPLHPSAIGYELSGLPGNRVLKIEWKNAGFAEGGPHDFIHFQVWLYESDNKIEVHFGPSQVNNHPAIFGPGGGPDIGLVSWFHAASLTVDGLYLQDHGNMPQVVVLNNAPAYPNLGTVPTNGTVYVFTRNVPPLTHKPAEAVVTFFPNPVRERLQLTGLNPGSDQATVTVFDALGKVVLQQAVQSAEFSMDMQSLKKGPYYVELTAGNYRTGKRIMKL